MTLPDCLLDMEATVGEFWLISWIHNMPRSSSYVCAAVTETTFTLCLELALRCPIVHLLHCQ